MKESIEKYNNYVYTSKIGASLKRAIDSITSKEIQDVSTSIEYEIAEVPFNYDLEPQVMSIGI